MALVLYHTKKRVAYARFVGWSRFMRAVRSCALRRKATARLLLTFGVTGVLSLHLR
ncbi:MAG: hypothetical protein JOZ78_05975 [Chroococcidiopsidaceae cyanobacterium CP_BM_ER_R8_30]|nr:hypothetical protein [Chroococcidiopsidaceae cyanobacterium CP_BM_ER_R8_30]